MKHFDTKMSNAIIYLPNFVAGGPMSLSSLFHNSLACTAPGHISLYTFFCWNDKVSARITLWYSEVSVNR